MKIYREKLLDYYKHPRCWGKIGKRDEEGVMETKKSNVSCGDKVEMGLRVRDGVIEEAKFEGEGCAVSLGTTSMLMEKIEGKKMVEVLSWDGDEVMKGLSGEMGEGRKKCQMLGWETLMELLDKEVSKMEIEK